MVRDLGLCETVEKLLDEGYALSVHYDGYLQPKTFDRDLILSLIQSRTPKQLMVFPKSGKTIGSIFIRNGEIYDDYR